MIERDGMGWYLTSVMYIRTLRTIVTQRLAARIEDEAEAEVQEETTVQIRALGAREETVVENEATVMGIIMIEEMTNTKGVEEIASAHCLVLLYLYWILIPLC
jgi:hypothetical protein